MSESATQETVTPAELSKLSSLQDLWAESLDVWQHGFMGVDVGKILIALLIFAVFMMLRGLFGRYVLVKLQNLTAKTQTETDDRIVEALIPPVKFVPVILGVFFSFQYAGLDELMGEIFTRMMRTLITFTLFWALYRALAPVSHGMAPLKRILTPVMVEWLFKMLGVLVILIGGAVILEIWGIRVGPLLAGFGLLGAAVALGAQDIFKNLIGGISLIAEKRFHPGEWIKIEGVVEGTVEDIGFRSTQIRRFDLAPVHVPNSQLSDAVVTNFSRMTRRRIYWMIGVEYRTTIDQLRTVRDRIMEYIQGSDAFDKSVTTFVRVDSFGASSIDILLYCFTHTTNWGEWLAVKEDLAFRIKQIVEDEAGTGFAFPSQSLYVEKWPEGERPEAFIPPA